MCFSATASFVAGASLSTLGVITTKKATRKSEIPFAMIPLLFGIQQIAEGVIWLSFQFDAVRLNSVMTYVYSIFSHVLWPIYVPFSILLLEPMPWRKKTISTFWLMGIMVGFYLLYFIIKFPVISHVVNKSIVYYSPHFYIFLVIGFYFASTCLSGLSSSHKFINLFGLLIFLSAVAAYQFYATSFISVWCFFAAILSMVVYLTVRRNGMTRSNLLKQEQL